VLTVAVAVTAAWPLAPDFEMSEPDLNTFPL
jgi:hypothetical protein